MPDEFEEISVVETELVESGAPVDASAEAVPPEVTPPEVTPAEVAATKVNLDAGDEALKQNSQTAYLEANAPDRVNESGAAVTLAGIAAKEEEKEEKRAQAFEHSQEEIKRSEARRDFMNKEHDFGDMKMSGADLEKLMNFMSNPQMQDKLRERLGKSGMPKEKVDKGMKELNEYAELKKKEKDGTLTEDQQRRLKEINQSEEFKVVTQETKRVAEEYGIKVSAQNIAVQEKLIIASSDVVKRTEARQEGMDALAKKAEKVASISLDSAEDDGIVIADNNAPKMAKLESSAVAAAEDDGIVVESNSELKKATANSYTLATAREFFPSAPPLMKDFEASSVVPVTASVSPALSADNDAVVAPSVVAASNKMPLASNARA